MNHTTMSILTVTYHKDFKLLNRLLASIEKYSKQNNFLHYIVLNDSIEHLQELKNIVLNYKSLPIRIYYWEEIPGTKPPLYDNCIFGTRYHDGWTFQQVLTHISSQVIETDYYLNLNSKDYLVDYLQMSDIIRNGKVEGTAEKFVHYIPQCGNVSYMNSCHFVNSYRVFKLNPWAHCDVTLVAHTPATLNTHYVKEMIKYFDEQNVSLLDVIGHNATPATPDVWETNKTNEYHLYSAWLVKNNLSNTVNWNYDHYRLLQIVNWSREL